MVKDKTPCEKQITELGDEHLIYNIDNYKGNVFEKNLNTIETKYGILKYKEIIETIKIGKSIVVYSLEDGTELKIPYNSEIINNDQSDEIIIPILGILKNEFIKAIEVKKESK